MGRQSYQYIKYGVTCRFFLRKNIRNSNLNWKVFYINQKFRFIKTKNSSVRKKKIQFLGLRRPTKRNYVVTKVEFCFRRLNNTKPNAKERLASLYCKKPWKRKGIRSPFNIKRVLFSIWWSFLNINRNYWFCRCLQWDNWPAFKSFNFNYLVSELRPKKTRLSKFFIHIRSLTLFFKPYKHFHFTSFFRDLNSVLRGEILLINYRRDRFFPSVQSRTRLMYATASQGLFAKRLNKGKAFIKNKSIYLLVASFLRKLLIYMKLRWLMLIVRRTPVYLREIFSTINTPMIAPYRHPFTGHTVDEGDFTDIWEYTYFIFMNSKSYTYMKTRKKGRLKRKITKRIIKINKLVD